MRRISTVLTLCLLATSAHADAQSAALALINDARAKAGCGALHINPALQSAAADYASAMATQNFFSHTGKDGSTLKSRIQRVGYPWRALAENIAAGQSSAPEVVSVWLGSAGHKKNMLNCAYSETGIAVVHQPDDAPIKGNSYPFHYYWVQVFGRP
jgi:uncharacterized protein YkwD